MREQLIDLALKILDEVKGELEFKDLWKRVVSDANLNEEYAVEFISDFYSDLSLDNRFIGVEKTKWDLRARRKAAEVIISTEDLLEDDEEDKMEFEE